MIPHHDCRKLLTSLSEYIDGSLDQALCAEIERHMANCENCHIVINTLRKTVELYQAASEAQDVPSDVRRRLFHRLDLEEYLEA